MIDDGDDGGGGDGDDGNTDIGGIDQPDHVDGGISIPNLSLTDAMNYSFENINIGISS